MDRERGERKGERGEAGPGYIDGNPPGSLRLSRLKLRQGMGFGEKLVSLCLAGFGLSVSVSLSTHQYLTRIEIAREVASRLHASDCIAQRVL